ncbi:hypothetical protein [Actinomadura sp. NPDC049753]|uniref:hypothetical protein n=1 Tax=Actinomadura sp. NPDC049753 TaxID=3154739 RepID=UPI0034165E32
MHVRRNRLVSTLPPPARLGRSTAERARNIRKGATENQMEDGRHMPKRIEVPDDPKVHLDDVAHDALEEAEASNEPVTLVYRGAEVTVTPETKSGPAAITARLLDAAGR